MCVTLKKEETHVSVHFFLSEDLKNICCQYKNLGKQVGDNLCLFFCLISSFQLVKSCHLLTFPQFPPASHQLHSLHLC